MVREKYVGMNQMAPSAKPNFDHRYKPAAGNSGTMLLNDLVGRNDLEQDPNFNLDDSGWDYCTEEQIEEMLLTKLDFWYDGALSELIGLGYGEDVAIEAILRNGHCYGPMDIMTNILHNSLDFLESGHNVDSGEAEYRFDDFRQLEEYSLACMVQVLRQMKPRLTKGDVLWCLLMSNLHMRQASEMEIPSDMKNLEISREIEIPNRFNLTPSLKTFRKKNVAVLAARYRVNSKELQQQVGPNEERENSKNQNVVNSVLTKFGDLNLDENSKYVSEDKEDALILDLTFQIKALEGQVKERREWAQQKVIQAARKLSRDMTEIKMLRMENKLNQQIKQRQQVLKETTMKWMSEMENSLRNAGCHVERANAVVRRLEMENAEIRADIEAFKLIASASVESCLEVAKREKRIQKRLQASEKQKAKLQEDIAVEKRNISELQEEFVRVEAAQKEAKAKWRQAQKAKELALAEVEEARYLNKATEAEIKRGHVALRQKLEIDFQRHMDNLHKLEQELSRLKSSPQFTRSTHQSNNLLDNQEDYSEIEGSNGRECLICKKDEVSVIFLPCAHQVLCLNCNDNYGKEGKAICPCCQVAIERRIRVFGA